MSLVFPCQPSPLKFCSGELQRSIEQGDVESFRRHALESCAYLAQTMLSQSCLREGSPMQPLEAPQLPQQSTSAAGVGAGLSLAATAEPFSSLTSPSLLLQQQQQQQQQQQDAHYSPHQSPVKAPERHQYDHHHDLSHPQCGYQTWGPQQPQPHVEGSGYGMQQQQQQQHEICYHPMTRSDSYLGFHC